MPSLTTKDSFLLIIAVAVLSTSIAVSIALSQESKFKFEHISLEQGLSQSTVNCILQDSRGFMWFGTFAGLNKFDGYDFTVYEHIPGDTTSLSHNWVYALHEDRSGVLWVGTPAGLDRFDRVSEQFIHYKHDPGNPYSLSDGLINTTLEDGSGTLWILTSSGLNRMDWPSQPSYGYTERRRKPRFIKYLQDLPSVGAEESSNISFTDAICDDFGTLWIGTNSGLLRLVPPASWDADSSSGAARSQSSEPLWARYFHDPQNPYSLSDNRVTSLFEDRSGAIWVGTQSGLNKFMPSDPTEVSRNDSHGTVEFTHYGANPDDPVGLSHNSVTSLWQDQSGLLWVGTDGGGLNLLDPGRKSGETERFIRHQHDANDPNSLSSNAITKIYEDRSGILWIGTVDRGLNKLDPRLTRFDHYTHDPDNLNSLSPDPVRAIWEDHRGVLWVGSWHGGLVRIDRTGDPQQAAKITRFVHNPSDPNSLSSSWVTAIYQDRAQVLWIGTNGGLNALYLGTEQTADRSLPFKKFDTPGGSAICEDRDGNLWVGIWGGGLYKLDRLEKRKHSAHFTIYRHDPADPFSLSNDIVRTLDIDKSGELWIGTEDGLNRFDLGTERFIRYQADLENPYSLRQNQINSIHEDQRGRLWIGTYGGGLNLFDSETEHFAAYGVKDGLPDNVVYGILEDDHGDLWISTNKGLARITFRPASGGGSNPEIVKTRTYGVADGIQSNEFSYNAYHKSRRTGEMFFGGPNGLNAFHPDSILDNPYVPPIVITHFEYVDSESPSAAAIVDRGISEKQAIEISYKATNISFEFAALSYRHTFKNRYAYKLEGVNDNWVDLGRQRRVTFAYFEPGDYVLRVKGSNNDGIWNEAGTSVRITVTPPPWKTWWAYMIYLCLTLAALYGARRYELNRLRLKNDLKLEQIEGEKLRELDSMKSRFFANISHEFRTPLTLVLGQINGALASVTESKTKEKLLVAMRNARRLLRLVSQLLDLSKLESGRLKLHPVRNNVIPFLKNVVFSFEALAEGQNVKLEFECDEPEIVLDYEPDKLEKIITNLLSNALKFTGEGGCVLVKIDTNIPLNHPSKGDLKDSPLEGGAPFGGAQGRLRAEGVRTSGFIEIIVKDTGIGIRADRLPHIFDRFYQVDSTDARRHEGTGIGLALAKELVELHGGTIAVNSEEGKGTEFIIQLPVSREPERDFIPSTPHQSIDPSIQQSTDPTMPQQASGIPPPASGDKEHVLIVEDNADVRAYIRDNLESAYCIREAANGEEGLLAAQETIPDLIISDVMMPRMDGYEFSRKIRADEKTSHIPIIMLTAKAGDEDKITGLQTGVDDYLIKPFHAKELLVRIENLIELRRNLRQRFSTATIIRPSEVSAVSADQAFLKHVLDTIESRMSDEAFNVETLAVEIHLSEAQLNRKLHALIGQPPGQLIRSMRLLRAADLLKQGAGNVAEICYQVGFSDQANFTRSFKKQFGVSPMQYKKHETE